MDEFADTTRQEYKELFEQAVEDVGDLETELAETEEQMREDEALHLNTIAVLQDKVRYIEGDLRRFQYNAELKLEREKKRSQTALSIIVKLEQRIKEKDKEIVAAVDTIKTYVVHIDTCNTIITALESQLERAQEGIRERDNAIQLSGIQFPRLKVPDNG